MITKFQKPCNSSLPLLLPQKLKKHLLPFVTSTHAVLPLSCLPPRTTHPRSPSSMFGMPCSTSAAGLFGYRPSLLQQCARAESAHFLTTLPRAVNVLASGEAPLFLQPFLAGGVSIDLAKATKGVRPLCCGDPL